MVKLKAHFHVSDKCLPIKTYKKVNAEQEFLFNSVLSMKEIWPLNFARKMHQKDAFNKKIIIIIIVGKHSEVNRPQSCLQHHPITAKQHIYGRYISQIICNLMRPRTQLNLTYILKEWIREQLQTTEHRLGLVNCVTAQNLA